MKITEVIESSAFAHPWNVIHLFEGGSALHGARMPGKSDLDIYGIFIEPKENIFGLTKYEHFVSTTSKDTVRNTSDDIDITLYSLRRWAALAAKGNPTALQFLFAFNQWPGSGCCDWEDIKDELREAIISKRCANPFRGFVTDQMKRLLGEKGKGKHRQRPDLTLTHGYDTKAAMHAVRLMHEGIELMNSGMITYPSPVADHLLAIRQGTFSLDYLCSTVGRLHIELDEAEKQSPLQEKPDYKKIDEVLIHAYEEFYQSR